MNTAIPPEVPADFRSVVIELPPGVGKTLGYQRGHRFVGFYWDPTKGPTWDDGEPMAAERREWWPFVAVAVRIGEFYGVNLGSSGDEATHLLVWDRGRQEAYLAPRRAATEFLKAQRQSRDLA